RRVPRRALSPAVHGAVLAVRDAGRVSKQSAVPGVARGLRREPDGERRRRIPLVAAGGAAAAARDVRGVRGHGHGAADLRSVLLPPRGTDVRGYVVNTRVRGSRFGVRGLVLGSVFAVEPGSRPRTPNPEPRTCFKTTVMHDIAIDCHDLSKRYRLGDG